MVFDVSVASLCCRQLPAAKRPSLTDDSAELSESSDTQDCVSGCDYICTEFSSAGGPYAGCQQARMDSADFGIAQILTELLGMDEQQPDGDVLWPLF